MMFFMFFILLASTQFLPQLVQDLLHYDATKAGLTLMPGGLVLLCMMPLVGFLVRKVQPKYMILFGFMGCGASLFYLSTFNATVAFHNVALARVFQASAVAFIFVPINTMAYNGLPKGKTNNASALINVMRNLGGSVGISVANALLVRRTQTHQNFLAGHLFATASRFNHELQAAAHNFVAHGSGSVLAGKQALVAFAAQMTTQATILAYLGCCFRFS